MRQSIFNSLPLLLLCIVHSSTHTMLFSNAFTAFTTRRVGRVLPHVPVNRGASSSSSLFSSKATGAFSKRTQPPASSSSKPTKPTIRKTQLKNDLKQYRMSQAGPLNRPAYTVFTNAALDEIYARLPTTHEELLEVKGIGPKKLADYGDDILSIVAQYTDVNGNLRRAVGGTSKPIPRPAQISANSLTDEQKRAANLLLKSNRSSEKTNGFITGSAGTGKSYVLKYLVQELRKTAQVGVCAPTGVAAIHVGGSTLHSFFGIGLGTGSIASLVKKVVQNAEAQKRIDETTVLIIDECSMLSSHLLETLDEVVREVRKEGEFAHLPFGGMQVICFGDFFQLPPIAKGEYDFKPFCFDSHVWGELGLTENMVELKEVQRQEKSEFVDLLNKVRVGDIDQRDIQQLNDRCVVGDNHPLPTDGIVPTRLYSLNRDVDGENEARLEALKGKEIICSAQNTWRENMPIGTLASVKKKMAESLSKEMPDEVRLKVGAQVMLTRNKDLERNLVNGSRGVVIRFDKRKDDEGVVPVVKFDCGVVTSIAPVEAVRYNPDGGAGCLVRQQIPLKLAWALTVHKSQGTTLTRALLDISSAFEFGQCYVALSRVRSLDGLWLVKPARLHNIKVSPQVLDFYHNSGTP